MLFESTITPRWKTFITSLWNLYPERLWRGYSKTGDRLHPTTVMAIMFQIAEALAQAHALGIIHRDIKPANILLHKQGRAMLSDFGLAHRLPDPRLTTGDAVAGTPSFMSPEQISGKTLSTATDIYSWGVCFYTLVTGILPYSHRSFPGILSEISSGTINLDSGLLKVLPGLVARYSAPLSGAGPAKAYRQCAESS